MNMYMFIIMHLKYIVLQYRDGVMMISMQDLLYFMAANFFALNHFWM